MTATAASHIVTLPDGTAVINLCGHAIRLVAEDGTAWEWPAAEHPAHAPTTSNRRSLGLPGEPDITAVWYDRPVLPAPQPPRTVYIVSLVTALLAADRCDLVVPHGQRRTDDGRLLVTECTGLAYAYPPPRPLPAVREDQAAGARLYADVDRCEHGRHFGDTCSLSEHCEGGVSLGNPLARQEPAVIAYGLDGHRWVVYLGRGPVRFVPTGQPIGEPS